MKILSITLAIVIFSSSFLYHHSGQKESAQIQHSTATVCTDDSSIAAVGLRVFTSVCGTCHKDDATAKAPSPGILSGMSARSVLAALTIGKMRVQAATLSDAERKAVAQFITKKELKETLLPKEAYTTFAISNTTHSVNNYSGWGGNLEGSGFRTAQQAGINPGNISSLALKWAFAFPDGSNVRSKPAVIDDWLITGSQFGDVYALNMKSGKIGWHFTADAAVRGAITVRTDSKNITAYFADYSTNVYAVDVKTGKLLWKTRAGYHPQSSNTGSVAVYQNSVFVPITSFEVISSIDPKYNCCTSSGGVVALDARTGKILWQYKVIAEEAKETTKKKNGLAFYGPSGAPVWCSPTVDAKRGLLYIGTGENYTYPTTKTSDAVQAIDMKTGKLVWSFQGNTSDAWNLACPGNPNCPETVGPDLDFGMAPLLIHKKDGTDVLIAGEKSGVVYALTPQGKLMWKTRIGKGGALGGIHWGMSTDGRYVYAANSDNLYGIPNVEQDSSVKPTPGLYALNINTGVVQWKTAAPACDPMVKGCIPSNSAAPAVIPGLVFAGSLDGHIRAYSAGDGTILWDYNTVKEFETINKIPGKGGSLDGPAPVVSNGMLFVNSGYGMFGEIPGNVLLAFEVGKK